MRPQRSSEQGAALIAVLFLVAIMSLAGLAVLEVSSRSIKRTQLTDAQAQGLWFVAGADEVGLSRLALLQAGDQLNLTRISPVLTLPYSFIAPNGWSLAGSVTDASNCFNLNSVVSEDEFDDRVAEDANILVFQQLVQAYGIPEGQAEALADALVDWIDEDRSSRARGAEDAQYQRRLVPHRTSAQPLESINELRSVIGFDADLVAQLEPVICARETLEASVININTLWPEQATLLVAAFGGELSIDQAVRLIEERPLGGWPSVEELLAEPSIVPIPEDARTESMLSITSNRLELSGVALIGNARQNFSLLYSISTDSPPRTVRRTFGEG